MKSDRKHQKSPNLQSPNDDVLKYAPLVKSIANYFYQLNNGVSYEDLVQEGWVGLLMARKKWQPDYGVTLGSFAQTYIFGRIYRSLLGTKNLIHNKKIILMELSDKIIDVRNTKHEFLLELYDYIDANYKIEQANVLKLVFQNYRKGEILKSCSITSEEYDSLIDHFNSNFD